MTNSEMLTVDGIRALLQEHRPRQIAAAEKKNAAVAILLTDGTEGPEILFIRRAEYAGDPWSGDVAFPGGGIEAEDSGPQQAAEREVSEEIGVQLTKDQYLGRLDDLRGAYLPIRISCFVYLLADKPLLKLNGEVVSGFWVPLNQLQSPARGQEVCFEYRGTTRSHPTIMLDDYCDHFLWGISYRLLESLFALGDNKSRRAATLNGTK